MAVNNETYANNDLLVTYLVSNEYINSEEVENAFRSIDRKIFTPEGAEEYAYRDETWSDGNFIMHPARLHATALEHLRVKPGMSFLNSDFGTGYFSTVVGTLIGSHGINHGIEQQQEVLNYAMAKQKEFIIKSSILRKTNFTLPVATKGSIFTVKNRRYDRIFGIGDSLDKITHLRELLEVRGIMIVVIGECPWVVYRLTENKWSYYGLLRYQPDRGGMRLTITVPQLTAELKLDQVNLPPMKGTYSLMQLSRDAVRKKLVDEIKTENQLANKRPLLIAFAKERQYGKYLNNPYKKFKRILCTPQSSSTADYFHIPPNALLTNDITFSDTILKHYEELVVGLSETHVDNKFKELYENKVEQLPLPTIIKKYVGFDEE